MQIVYLLILSTACDYTRRKNPGKHRYTRTYFIYNLFNFLSIYLLFVHKSIRD